MPHMPRWMADARTRPVMQLTAVKLDDWFVPGSENKLLARDVAGTKQADEIYKNLINPAVATVNNIKQGEQKNTEKSDTPKTETKTTVKSDSDTGYKSSERTALEKQLLQIETSARAAESQEKQ